MYFLFEHKSYQSPLTALQLLKFMIAIWELKTNKEKQKKLPIIIPLIVYHGENRWNIQPSLSYLI
ncbi:MAG: Rpn family recombination-promoting nuclease/putative transposase, partial [Desulfitobacteriaceae bacterium]|nr:Rpn family recombination-promoting nuclease/putative transposase [Desulfitobacteriaceae bacterium]